MEDRKSVIPSERSDRGTLPKNGPSDVPARSLTALWMTANEGRSLVLPPVSRTNPDTTIFPP
jgi:hypothetical protein